MTRSWIDTKDMAGRRQKVGTLDRFETWVHSRPHFPAEEVLMRFRFTTGFCLLVVGIAVPVALAQTDSGKTSDASVASGRELYVAYCASCHGKDGKGKGPAASSLKTPPPDLTALAQKNDGKFPKERVLETISGETAMSAHGSRQMPVWGPFFLALSGMKEKAAKSRMEDLANYIETIQSK